MKQSPYREQFLHSGDSGLQFTVTPDQGAQLCTILVDHVGDNFPCFTRPGPIVTGHENFKFLTDMSTLEDQCGLGATVQFTVRVLLMLTLTTQASISHQMSLLGLTNLLLVLLRLMLLESLSRISFRCLDT